MAARNPVVFEPDYLEGFRQIFEEKIVFNQILGVKLTRIDPVGIVEARLEMRHDLVGHFAYGRVHGGVISASLDAIGSAAVFAAQAAKHMNEPPAKRLDRFAKLGTIDLRVDWRPLHHPRRVLARGLARGHGAHGFLWA